MAARLVCAVALLLLAGHADALAKPSGALGSSLLESLKAAGTTPLRVVSCIGSQGSGKTTLMRSMFGEAVEQETLMADDGLVLLEAEGSCTLAPRSKAVKDNAAALAAADVAVYNVFTQDLQRSVDSALTELQSALEAYLASCPPDAPSKPLVLAVRDFDGEESDKAEVQAALESALGRMWERAVRPASFSGKTVGNVLDVSFTFLPSFSLAGGEYAKAAAALREQLAAGEKGTTAAEVARKLQAAPAQVAATAAYESTPPSELAAALAAKTNAAQALASFKNRVAALASSLENGLDPEFGAHIDVTIDEALEQFNDAVAAAGVPGGSAVVARKRFELRAAMVREASALHASQFRLLRAAAADRFKRAPGTLRVSPTLSKDLDAAAKEAEAYFADTAKGLRSKYLPTLAEHERRELRSELRGVSDERLQLARLQGLGAARSRRPVGVALHWLLPEPFGTDAARSPLGAADEPAFAGTRTKADSLFFEFAPLDEVPGPEGRRTEVPPQWAAIKDRAERMVFRRAAAAGARG